MTDKAVIEGLKKDEPQALEYVYTVYRLAFIDFAKKYPLADDTMIDVYQDAIIALRDNAMSGKIDDLKSELKTYLFSIGKYMIYHKIKQQKKMHLVEEISNFNFEDDALVYRDELTNQQKMLRSSFKTLGEKCKSVLTLFYYRGFDIEDIMNELNYSSKDVVKSQKSRCLKSLKAMLLKK